MIDLEAIRKRNENSKHTNQGAPACGVCDEQHCAQTEEDIDALIAEVEGLRLNAELAAMMAVKMAERMAVKPEDTD